MKETLLPKLTFLLCFLLITITSCRKDINGAGKKANAPGWLRTGWITPDPSGLAATTYDFNQVDANGYSSVQIQHWQRIGSLGFSASGQTRQGLFTWNENTQEIVIQRPYSSSDIVWKVISLEDTRILVENNGQQYYVFNCREPDWPLAIKLAIRACN